MPTFEFKSKICTTKEQSERLLALGLKPETADMMIITKSNHIPHEPRIIVGYDYKLSTNKAFDTLPAWSLHRLIEIIDYPSNIDTIKELLTAKTIFNNRLYDRVISIIEYLISNNHFNKDYLENEIK
jgi:hypothetical protein